MNAKDFTRLGVPLREATRRATDFVSKSILGGGVTKGGGGAARLAWFASHLRIQ